MANTITNNGIVAANNTPFKFNKKGGFAPVSAFRLNEANRFGMGINPAHVEGLAISIAKEGWLNSSVLEVTEDGEIQSGNHRFLGAEKAGYTGEIPYVVVSAKLSETDRLIRSYAANISLGNSPLETALLVGELSRSGMKNKAIAARLMPGKKGAETIVSQCVGFVRSAPPWLISAIEDGKISYSQAKEIAGEKDIDSKREEIESRTSENPWKKIALMQGPIDPRTAQIFETIDKSMESEKADLEKVEKTRAIVAQFKALLGIQVKTGSEHDLSLEDGVKFLLQTQDADKSNKAQKMLESIFGAENTQKQIAKQTLANVSSVVTSPAPAPQSAPATIGPDSDQAKNATANPDLALPNGGNNTTVKVITLETIAAEFTLSDAVSRLLELKDEGDAQKLDTLLAEKHGREALDAEVDRQDGEASKADIAPAPQTQNNPKTERKGMVSIRKTPGRVRALARELSGMLASLPLNEVGGQAEWIDKHAYITADGRPVLRIMLDGKAYLLTLGDDCVG